MSDGDGGACAFGAAPNIGSEAQVLSDQFCVYKLSPQEARDPLSNLPQSVSIELASTDEGGTKCLSWWTHATLGYYDSCETKTLTPKGLPLLAVLHLSDGDTQLARAEA